MKMSVLHFHGHNFIFEAYRFVTFWKKKNTVLLISTTLFRCILLNWFFLRFSCASPSHWKAIVKNLNPFTSLSFRKKPHGILVSFYGKKVLLSKVLCVQQTNENKVKTIMFSVHQANAFTTWQLLIQWLVLQLQTKYLLKRTLSFITILTLSQRFQLLDK